MEDIKKDETVISEVKTGVDNDKGGEIKETKVEETKGEVKTGEEFDDESLIDEDVKTYKQPVPTTEDDEDIDAEDKVRIEKVVQKTVGSKLQEIERKAELDGFFNDNPELSKYKRAVGIYKAHPTYAGVPIANLAAMLSAKDSLKIGAMREREAQRKVAETRNPGGTARDVNLKPNNWLSASKDDFETQKAKVLGRIGY